MPPHSLIIIMNTTMGRNIIVAEPLDYSNHISKIPLNVGWYNNCVLPSTYTLGFFANSTNRRLQQTTKKKKKKVPATLARAHHIPASTSNVAADANEKHQPLELAALVTVVRKGEKMLNITEDTMLNWLSQYDHHKHKGVVLQLVSTQVHPSKLAA